MTDQATHNHQLLAEAEAFFELLRTRPGDEDVLAMLSEWVTLSDAHRAVFQTVAATWISTLSQLAANAPEIVPRHGSTFH